MISSLLRNVQLNYSLKYVQPKKEKLSQVKENILNDQATESGRDENAKKQSKRKDPQLYGNYIKHKWDDGWHTAKVTAVLDSDSDSSDCEFQVQYKTVIISGYQINMT